MAPQTRSKTKGGSSNNKDTKNDTGSASSGDIAAANKTKVPTLTQCSQFYKKYVNVTYAKRALTDPEYTWLVASVLFCCEIFINIFIILGRQCKKKFFKKVVLAGLKRRLLKCLLGFYGICRYRD
jgi:hypothetical protein